MVKKIIAVPRSPLDGAEFSAEGLTLQEERFVGKIIIRGKSEDTAFIAAAKEVLSVDLPLVANTVAEVGGDKILWLGPDEWLLWTTEDKRQKTIERLTQALEGLQAAVVDLSDYYTLINLSGKAADEILSHGCPLDLRPASFAVGSCAQSRYRNANILLYKKDDSPSYTIQIRWSYAEYLWDYFVKVGRTIITD